MAIGKSDHIVIVGGGAFGLSTALELTRNGYTNISIFEKDKQIPSQYSAANDLNKIVRAEYEDDFYTELAVVMFFFSFFLFFSFISMDIYIYIYSITRGNPNS